MKFTHDGVRLAHKPQNHYEWYVKVPHVEDYHLWLPAVTTLEHNPWLEALYAGDAEMGECRLLKRDGSWCLHATATREITIQSATDSDWEPVGLDIGDDALATVCHGDRARYPDHSQHLQR